MAVALRTYLNNQIKSKGSTLAEEKAKAGKYKSIAAAKKAGSLYYTDKNGKVMAAVYAEDLKKAPAKAAAPKKSLRPKARPTPDPDKIEVKSLVQGGRGDGRAELMRRTSASRCSVCARSTILNPLAGSPTEPGWRTVSTSIAKRLSVWGEQVPASATVQAPI